MESAVAPAKVSAQSPPCSQNAAPAAASATRSLSYRTHLQRPVAETIVALQQR